MLTTEQKSQLIREGYTLLEAMRKMYRSSWSFNRKKQNKIGRIYTKSYRRWIRRVERLHGPGSMHEYE